MRSNPKRSVKGGNLKIICKKMLYQQFFNHMTLPKKRKASLDRDLRNAKQIVVEAAPNDYQEEIESKIKEASTDNSDLVPKRDIGLNRLPKVNSEQTQWSEADITESLFICSRQPDKIKIISKPVKPKTICKEVGLNTDLSFSPNADIVISQQSTILWKIIKKTEKPRKRLMKTKAIFCIIRVNLKNRRVTRKN